MPPPWMLPLRLKDPEAPLGRGAAGESNGLVGPHADDVIARVVDG